MVDQLEKQLETKNVKIKKLDDRLRHQEQYSRVDMIELRGIEQGWPNFYPFRATYSIK